MQEEKSIISKTYKPISLSDTATITFTKVINSGNLTINGRVSKNSAEVGQVSYNEKSGALIVKLTLKELTTLEQTALLKSLPGYINEILSE